MLLRGGVDASPLHRIPFAMKDMVDVQGWVATAGCDALSDNVATRDATVVRCLRGAGMVLVDKTQTVQFAMGVPRSNHHHGTPHNRWTRVRHVPGGRMRVCLRWGHYRPYVLASLRVS